jgi:cytochrome P450
VLDRQPNRHLAFGAGVHRCPGADLSRLLVAVAIGEVLRRLPDYAVADDEEIGWQIGHTCGINRLPLIFSPAS